MQEYIKTLVDDAFSVGGLHATEEVRAYVTFLLSDLRVPKEKPFAIQFLEATKTPSRQEYARIGDGALVMTGFFPEKIHVAKVRHAHPGISYVQELGSMSYLRAADMSSNEVYDSLGRYFKDISECLQAIPLGNPEHQLLKLYERFKITHSKALETLLRNHGLLSDGNIV
jgi:hypothetical protein